jgi:purine-binding chemotaxis protein CheW
MTSTAAQPPRQLVTFKIGEYLFGIDVLEVQEVLKHQQMTPVPLAPKEVRGLINLRGHIVTAIDMRERLHQSPAGNQNEQMNLIVSLKDGAASLIVDSVGDVITLERDRYKARPSTLRAPLREMVTGVYELDKSLLLHLDPETACTVSEMEA